MCGKSTGFLHKKEWFPGLLFSGKREFYGEIRIIKKTYYLFLDRNRKNEYNHIVNIVEGRSM